MTKYNGSDLTSLNDNLLEKNYAPAYGMPWWKILQKYMRIDGDIKTQSVVMTIVYNDSTQGGHTRYKRIISRVQYIITSLLTRSRFLMIRMKLQRTPREL